MDEVNLSILDETGANIEVPLSLKTYKEAEAAKLTVPQYINQRYRTNPDKYGTAFSQVLASAGLFLRSDNKYGIKPPSLGEMLSGDAANIAVNLGSAVVRPDGSKSDTISGRLLFPAVLLEMVENALRPNIETYIGAFMAMVSQTVNVSSPKYEQPIVNYSKARGSRSGVIAQLDKPPLMATFTLSERSSTLPTYSIGLQFSDQAVKGMTVDFIAKCISEQQIFERASRMTDDLMAVVNGDTDYGTPALSAITSSSLDSSATSAATFSQKAWVKFLRKNWMYMTITDVICDIDTYLAIQGRVGRPTRNDQSTTDERLNTTPKISLPGIPGEVNIFVTDGSPLGTNTLLGLDRSKALRRVVYTGAAYSEIEQWVLRRGYAMRIDWSERIEQAGFPDSFSLMTFA